ncbi:MAG: 50S ribosomal protein L9 [Candidatus Margulisbacteria bacterium]|nr:50S ribosomal protein L9 [Candidatus Margulisiibacteriota bacterium]
MEVILIKDLKRKGTFGDTIDVATGYAVNYLIPNGFALSASDANKKLFDQMKDKALANVTEQRSQLKDTAKNLEGKSFTMVALSRDGKLYGSITPSVIVNQMIRKELPDVAVNASDVIIDDGNIKYVGTYQCRAQFTKDIFATFTIVIESDESDEQPELLEAIIESEHLDESETDEPEDEETDEPEDSVLQSDSDETLVTDAQPDNDADAHADIELAVSDSEPTE